MLFTNKKYFDFAKDPAVIKFDKRYYLYYTMKYNEANKLGVGIAQSDDMEEWEPIGDIPLEQVCEKNGIAAPAAIVLDNKIHLFYQTYGNGKKDAICHAVSEDGINFKKDTSNPIFHPSCDWCCGRAIDADVCVFKDKLYLYFATRDHQMKIQKLGCAWAELKSDFSKGSWHQAVPQTILTPELEWEGECIEAPATVVNNEKIFMFYGGSYNCTPQQIGCAVSEDGVFYKKMFLEPFLKCGMSGEWNSCESGHPYVFKDEDNRVYLFYQGSSDRGKTWYLSKTEIKFNEYNIPYLP